MKIAFIGQKGIPVRQGGVERHVEQLALHLHDLGHDVSVYSDSTYTKNSRSSYKGISIIPVFSVASKRLGAITRTLFASLDVLRRDVDVIHYHGVGPATLSWIPRLFKRNAKVIATFHCRDQFHAKWGFFAKAYLAFGEWAICKFPHKTITVSKQLAEYCLEKYNTEAYYIPNGCYIEPTEQSNELSEFDLEPQGYVLAVSRLVAHKGIHYLIEAFKKLDTGLKLVIVGDTSHTDEYLAKLQKMAKGDSRIIFAGFQGGEALAQLYSNARVYVHPSEAEGLPITVLEAMGYGIPTVVSDIPENVEASGEYAYTFANTDVTDLAKTLMRALNHYTDSLYMAQNGQRYIERNYSWPSITNSVERVYEDSHMYRRMFVGSKVAA